MYCPYCGQLNMDEVTWPFWSRLAIMLWLAIIGILTISLLYWVAVYDAPPDFNVSHTTINIASPVMSNRTIDGEVRWDASFGINKITPKDQTIKWSDLYLVIRRENGSYLQQQLKLEQDDPSRYDNASDGSIKVETWYLDHTGGGKNADSGDVIVVTGLGKGLEGCSVSIMREGYQQGSIVLPMDFT